MQAVSVVQRAIGIDYTSYLLIFTGNSLWVLSLMFCSEDKKMDLAVMSRWRGITMIIVSAILCRVYGSSWSFAPKDLFKLNIRNVLIGIHAICMTFALRYLTTPIVHTISNSGPIIVFVMDYFINGKTITKRELHGIIVTTVGLFATVNASLLMYWMGFEENIESHYDYIDANAFIKTMVALILFLNIIGWSYGIVITKELTHTNVLQITLHVGIVSTLMAGVLSFI
jgi:drug/metabolite transporter (DMT)-like permease